MKQSQTSRGREELRRARRENRGLFWAVGLFSILINALMLTGPIFMLQVYDRVLGSQSEATLAALFGLVVFLYMMMTLLEIVRSRLLSRVGANFQHGLDQRVFAAALLRASGPRAAVELPDPLEDLSAIRRFLSSPIVSALYDLPFTPLFLLGIAIFHPLLGLLALGGGAVLVGIAVLNQTQSRGPNREAMLSSALSSRMSQQLRDGAESVRSLGMQGAAFRRWQGARHQALVEGIQASDASSGYSSASRGMRLLLQSSMLALGALLVLRMEATGGVMIASSILMGRALQPIEVAIGQWGVYQRARTGWAALSDLLGEVAPQVARTSLPRPAAKLKVDQLSIVPPGETIASLRMISFEVTPGEAVGVIGPSGAGKSSLARALTGVWRPASGSIRLDGATLDQYDPDVLGLHIGYLPQRVQLFEGSIAENIARLAEVRDDEKIVTAARKAAAHDMILSLPRGYDTMVTASGGRLSGGQLQRIGLARALYGDPVLLILDEPNSNLDNEGSMALNASIRRLKAEGSAVLIMAHRPAAIQECERLLVIDGGLRRAFGPRDQVLRDMVQNSAEILRKPGPGGVQ
ncbi:Type I secretion system ATP-binding protein PrsD [Aquimixticola soesokkakensis]|uniref:Type I secretion system ATP-binding protein PrsD n=1 Tax=Aquimixticola soesokkakensis TaxID=1519096 RepID=A0A1Y5RGR4_9RHOB|nr:type I secretion system permease/ATPase [Aquimixticola soesokkakensis]SLN16252.1 Type I secretion system ATP-binding protein PrsD [Aquimixticola soesokkakensis]